MNALAVFLLFTVVAVTIGFTQTVGVDWKFYAFAPLDGTSWCFYDAKGVVTASQTAA